MHKYNKLFIIVLLSVLMGFVACKKDDNTTTPPTINESELAVTYLEGQGDYFSSSFVITAADYKTTYLADTTKVYTIDIRSTADYTTKHLKGAKNVALADLYTHIKALTIDNYTKIVVACYSGQTAAYGVALVRAALPFAQASKVVSLKWGMSSIDSSFATNYWLAKRGNGRAAQFVVTAAPAKPVKGSLPTLSTGKTTGAEIVAARVQALLTEGFSAATINDATLYTSLSSYYIINYWPNSLYLLPGHVDGAYNYEPAAKPFAVANDLKTLPTDKDVVIYCYTGQSSAYVAGLLRIYGYKAKTLTYGANGMIYDLMVAQNVANTFIPANEIKGYKDLLQ